MNTDFYVCKYVAIRYRTANAEEILIRQTSQDLKIPTVESIAVAAPAMAKFVDAPSWLVPVPASDGGVYANLMLARTIAAFTFGTRVKCAVGRTRSVTSSSVRRLRGLPGLTKNQHCIVRTVGPMQLLPVYFVDNVITTGTTIAACRQALGWGNGLAYADASSPRLHWFNSFQV